MDKIGEANKPFEARVEDVMEDKRQKEQEQVDDKESAGGKEGMDTGKLTPFDFGLDFVFRMSEPVLPGDEVPEFTCNALVGDSVETVSKADFEGSFVFIIFYPKDFTKEGEDVLNMVADLMASEELNLEVLLISTDSVETHRVWAQSMDGRNGGAPVVPMLGDTTGEVAKIFGVLDTVTHLAYNAMFLIDMNGVVQAVKVYGQGGLAIGGAGEILDLAREAFSDEEEVVEAEQLEGSA